MLIEVLSDVKSGIGCWISASRGFAQFIRVRLHVHDRWASDD